MTIIDCPQVINQEEEDEPEWRYEEGHPGSWIEGQGNDNEGEEGQY